MRPWSSYCLSGTFVAFVLLPGSVEAHVNRFRGGPGLSPEDNI
jgi:hypothetical protein